MIKSILLSVDGSAYTDAVLKCGIHLAREFDAKLKVISIVDIRIFEWALAIGADGFVPVIPSSLYQEESKRLLEEKADAVLTKCSGILRKEGVLFELQKISGPPVDVICEQAHLVDLVVMGARGEFAKWESKMIGATLEAVTRQSNKPILITPVTYRGCGKILIAYDGSDNSNKALQLAAFFGTKLAVPMTVLTVTEDANLGQKVCEEARRYFGAHDVTVQTEIVSGHPDVKIVQHANQNNFDLIIMGAYGHSRIREAILGSTTEQVMRNASVPVLLAK